MDLWNCIANKDSLFRGPNIQHHIFVRDFCVDPRFPKKKQLSFSALGNVEKHSKELEKMQGRQRNGNVHQHYRNPQSTTTTTTTKAAHFVSFTNVPSILNFRSQTGQKRLSHPVRINLHLQIDGGLNLDFAVSSPGGTDPRPPPKKNTCRVFRLESSQLS